jgi:hypothetical protein
MVALLQSGRSMATMLRPAGGRRTEEEVHQ